MGSVNVLGMRLTKSAHCFVDWWILVGFIVATVVYVRRQFRDFILNYVCTDGWNVSFILRFVGAAGAANGRGQFGRSGWYCAYGWRFQ